MRAPRETLPLLFRTGVASPYPLGRDDVHVPPTKIRGRCEGGGHGHFTGWIDSTTGRLRIDHSNNMAFWMEVDLFDVMEAYMAWKYRPGGSAATAAVGNARNIANDACKE